MRKLKIDDFKAWLAARGAEVLEPTNPYELLRFRTSRGVSVLYTKATGEQTPTGECALALKAYQKGGAWDAGVKSSRVKLSPRVKSLIARDGSCCFLCLQPMAEDDISIDHLVPVAHGGPNHMSNLVLMHPQCNHSVGHQPPIKKILLREQNRARLQKESTE